MAIRDRRWVRWEGRRSPARGRWLILTRYSLEQAFSSRLFLGFYVLCLVPSLVALLAIYLSHNTDLLQQFEGLQGWFEKAPQWIFRNLIGWQAIPALFVALIAAPPLVAADIANNGLAVVLARPIGRHEYLLGKGAVVFALLSPITWIPGVAAYLVECLFAGPAWAFDNIDIGVAYLIGHLVWIVVLTTVFLAMTAWLRLTTFARGTILGLFLVSSVVGRMINGLTKSSLGDLIHLSRALESAVLGIFGAPRPSGLPVIANWLTLVAVTVAALWILNRRLRACPGAE